MGVAEVPMDAMASSEAPPLQNNVTGDRTGNHLPVLEDLGIGCRSASPGFGCATDTGERNTRNGSVEVLHRKLKVGGGGALWENYVDCPSGGDIQQGGEKSAVHCPALVA